MHCHYVNYKASINWSLFPYTDDAVSGEAEGMDLPYQQMRNNDLTAQEAEGMGLPYQRIQNDDGPAQESENSGK